MFTSLLVPLDGSTLGERSLPLARAVSSATGAHVHLARVHEHHEPDCLLSNPQFHFEGLSMPEYDARDREEERAYLAGVEERLRDQGTPVDSALLDGPISGELATYADHVDADAIFITTHGHSGVSRMWLGSVADWLIRHTNMPLIVVHPGKAGPASADLTTFEHILVALDGSTRAEAILGPAVSLSRATGARLTLLNIVSSGWAGAGILPLFGNPESTKPVEEYLGGVADKLRGEGLDVQIEVRSAIHPARAIIKAARELGADGIALGTHGHTGLKKGLLGSVADQLLRSSALPMLVQRP